MPKYIRCVYSCSVVSFKSKLNSYFKNIVNLPGRPGFSNSLVFGDISQWWTQREDLAAKQPQVTYKYSMTIVTTAHAQCYVSINFAKMCISPEISSIFPVSILPAYPYLENQ